MGCHPSNTLIEAGWGTWGVLSYWAEWSVRGFLAQTRPDRLPQKSNPSRPPPSYMHMHIHIHMYMYVVATWLRPFHEGSEPAIKRCY